MIKSDHILRCSWGEAAAAFVSCLFLGQKITINNQEDFNGFADSLVNNSPNPSIAALEVPVIVFGYSFDDAKAAKRAKTRLAKQLKLRPEIEIARRDNILAVLCPNPRGYDGTDVTCHDGMILLVKSILGPQAKYTVAMTARSRRLGSSPASLSAEGAGG